MPASDDIRDGFAEAFDTLSDEFLSGVTIALYKVSATSDAFESVLTISSKRFFEYSNYRKNFLLEIADDSDALTTAMGSATHVKVGNDYYVIIDGDTVAPNSTSVTWKLFCDRFEEGDQYAEL